MLLVHQNFTWPVQTSYFKEICWMGLNPQSSKLVHKSTHRLWSSHLCKLTSFDWDAIMPHQWIWSYLTKSPSWQWGPKWVWTKGTRGSYSLYILFCMRAPAFWVGCFQSLNIQLFGLMAFVCCKRCKTHWIIHLIHLSWWPGNWLIEPK